MSSQKKNSFHYKSIRETLKSWPKLAKLGQHPLAQLKIIKARRQKEGYNKTDDGYGLALRAELREIINSLKPNDEQPDRIDERWGHYLILTEQYLENRKRKYVQDTYKIVGTTYDRWQRHALARVGSILQEREQQYSPLEEPAPPAKPSELPFTAPPMPSHTLIGRDQMLARLRRRLFAGDSVALFALNGLPGVGKTALAIALAHDSQVRDYFSDGILWAGLGREPDLASHLSTWGLALGIPASQMGLFATIEQQARAIHAAIGTRRMLLVIDDAWQIEHALAFKLGGPNCAHILTTRQPELALDFAEEGARSVHELNETDSLTLLAEFVPRVVVSYPEEARALVRAVDGLPLALILMGRYLRKAIRLGRQEALPHLLEQLQIIRTRLELTMPRSPLTQQPSLPYDVPLSLLASIEISDNALEEAARQVLRALSVFLPKPNTFSQEAALAVSAKPLAKLKMLTEAGLLENSGTARYTMHQVIADYASSKNSTPDNHRRAATYFADFAHQHRYEGYNLLDLDWQNIDHAMQWAYNNQQWPPLIQGVQGLTEPNLGVCGFMDARGHWNHVRALLRHALEGTRATGDSEAEATILTKLGAFAFRQADFKSAEEHLTQSLSRLEQLPKTEKLTLQRTHCYEFLARLEMGREMEAAHEWIDRGLTEMEGLDSEAARYQKGSFNVLLSELNGRTGRFPEAIEAAEKGLVLLPPFPTSARIVGLIVLGNVFNLLGNFEKSIEYQKEGIQIAQTLGDWRRLATLWMNLGNNEGFQRLNLPPAIVSYQKALQLYQRMGDANGESNVHYNLGLFYIMLGEDELALTHLTTAIRLIELHGLLRQEAFAKTNLAQLQICRGGLVEATSSLNRALDICQQLELTSLLPGLLRCQAEISRLNGNHNQALTLIEKSLQVAKEAGRLQSEGMGWSIKGKILDGMKRFDEAEAAHQASLQILAKQSPYELARSKMALGEHYIRRDGYLSQRAKAFFITALETFERIGAKREIALAKGLLEE